MSTDSTSASDKYTLIDPIIPQDDTSAANMSRSSSSSATLQCFSVKATPHAQIGLSRDGITVNAILTASKPPTSSPSQTSPDSGAWLIDQASSNRTSASLPSPFSDTSCITTCISRPASSTDNEIGIPDNALLCPVCSGFFKRPRVLRCLHAACHECLYASLRADRCGVTCAKCGMVTRLPLTGLEGLLPGFALENVIAERELRRAHEAVGTAVGMGVGTGGVTGGVSCEKCARGWGAKGSGHERQGGQAVKRCCDCNEFLCEDCAVVHRLEMQGLNDHRVVDIDSTRSVDFSRPLVWCRYHPECQVSVFCRSCWQPVCQACRSRGACRLAGHRDFCPFEEVAHDQLSVLRLLAPLVSQQTAPVRAELRGVERALGALPQRAALALAAINEIYGVGSAQPTLTGERDRGEHLRAVQRAGDSRKAQLESSVERLRWLAACSVRAPRFLSDLIKHCSSLEILSSKNFIEYPLLAVIQHCYDCTNMVVNSAPACSPYEALLSCDPHEITSQAFRTVELLLQQRCRPLSCGLVSHSDAARRC